MPPHRFHAISLDPVLGHQFLVNPLRVFVLRNPTPHDMEVPKARGKGNYAHDQFGAAAADKLH
jgi:hypothetical protein